MNEPKETIFEIEFDMELEKGHDEKGMYVVCPKCKQKCRYTTYAVSKDGEPSYSCECVKCEMLFDED